MLVPLRGCVCRILATPSPHLIKPTPTRPNTKVNTAFKRRWFLLHRQSRTLTYAKEPGATPCGTLVVVGADITLTAADDGVPELHVKCEDQPRVFILRGEALEEWQRALKSVS